MKHYTLLLCILVFAIDANAQNCCSPSASMSLNSVSTAQTNLEKNHLAVEVPNTHQKFEPYELQSLAAKLPPESDTLINGVSLLNITSLSFGYGLTCRLTLFASLPYVSRYETTLLHLKDGQKHHEITYFNKGLSDAIIAGSYSILRGANSKIKVSVLAGTSLPTGKKWKDNENTLLGSGSINPIVGLNFSRNWRQLSLSGNARYKRSLADKSGLNTGGYATGELLINSRFPLRSCDTICSCRLSVIAFTGIAIERITDQETKGVIVPNTGRSVALVKAGLSFIVLSRITIPISIDLPFIQSVQGLQNYSSTRIRVGISYTLK